MKFQVVNIEPPGFKYPHFLDDLCRLLCYGLESLGHHCTIARNSVDPTRWNILTGAHLLSNPQDAVAIASQVRYVVLQSEVINPGGVNLHADQRHLNEVYLPLLRGAADVWDAFESNVQALAQRGIQARHFLGGYHPRLEEIQPKSEADVDFLFFGSLTPHRRSMLDQLRQRGHRVVFEFDGRAIFRNDLIARAKVHLSPRQGAGMDQLPWQRISYLLNNRGLVVVEQCREQQWLEECFAWSETAYWVDLCEQTLHRPDRLELAERYYQRYRQLPFTDRLEELLDGLFASRSGEQSVIPVQLEKLAQLHGSGQPQPAH